MSDPTTILAEQVAAAAAGAARGFSVVPGAPAAIDYDWGAPHRFVRAERERLRAFAAKAAEKISLELIGLLRRQFKFLAGEVTERYGHALWNPVESPLYGVPLTDKSGRTCGMVGLAPALAIDWVERLLGSSESAASGTRALSSLESALVVDIVAAMVKAMAEASKEVGGPVFQHVDSVSTEQSPLAGRERDEFCLIPLMAEAGQIRPAISLVILSDLLDPIAEPAPLKKKPKTAEDIRREILGHLEGVTVSATVRLGVATVTMRDVLALQPDDILLLGKTVSDPIDLVVAGNVVHHGLPVSSAGCYALQVLEKRQWPRVSTAETK